MKSHIYKIYNDINTKLYIGKTNLTVRERFRQHCNDCTRRNEEQRPLYNAMNKYGIEHFFVEEIEECDAIKASEREQYWIHFFDSYNKGYNATLGGDGSFLYDYSIIENYIKEGKTCKEIIDIVGCCSDTVRLVAKNNNLELKQDFNQLYFDMMNNRSKVNQYTKDGLYINSFVSFAEAAKWLVANNYAKTYNGGVRSHIRDVCLKKRKTAYGFIWELSQ